VPTPMKRKKPPILEAEKGFARKKTVRIPI
jgi:hypothetical protein